MKPELRQDIQDLIRSADGLQLVGPTARLAKHIGLSADWETRKQELLKQQRVIPDDPPKYCANCRWWSGPTGIPKLRCDRCGGDFDLWEAKW